MSGYIPDALDARDVFEYIVCHRHPSLRNSAQIVEFRLGRRDYSISVQDPDFRANFSGQIAKAREVIEKRKAEASK